MIIQGTADHIPLADRCVQCVVTSPPYWCLRDYGVSGQIGQEPLVSDYVARLVAVFREVRRVLRDDGTFWLNLGDSYASSGKYRTEAQATAKSTLLGGKKTQTQSCIQPTKRGSGLADKQLVGVPWRVAFALQEDGWILRSDVIWEKPNAMPSSVADRPASSHEHIFLLTKCPKYYYHRKAVQVPAVSTSLHHFVDGRPDKQRGHGRRHAGFNDRYAARLAEEGVPTHRNLRDVWRVPTACFSEAHFATFPPDLIKPCILAGCPEGGIVLDPFLGSGTTLMVAQNLGRRGVGIELRSEYIHMARLRTAQRTLC